MTATTTEHRIDHTRFEPATQLMYAMHRAIVDGPLEPGLLDLVRIRTSQLNGCAFCVDMHVDHAREGGEDQQRLDVLSAWRDTTLFDDRERAALALTEAVTLVADEGVPDAVIADAEAHFTPEELATLVFAATETNTWNRLVRVARTPVPSRRR